MFHVNEKVICNRYAWFDFEALTISGLDFSKKLSHDATGRKTEILLFSKIIKIRSSLKILENFFHNQIYDEIDTTNSSIYNDLLKHAIQFFLSFY